MVYNTSFPAATAQKWRNAVALLGDMNMLQVQVNVITKTSIMKARLHGVSDQHRYGPKIWHCFGMKHFHFRTLDSVDIYCTIGNDWNPS